MSESPPPTMKALVHHHYGGPEQLGVENVAVPEPGPKQVRIALHAASVNAADWRLLRAEPFVIRLSGTGVFRPRHGTLGLDGAGVIDAVGTDVTDLRLGDAVFGEFGRGAFAEFAVGDPTKFARKPDAIDFATAATLPVAGTTALQGLRDVAKLQAGERVLINGASGSVGSFAVQIAKALGAHVTGVCSAEKTDLVRSLGADATIDHRAEDYTKRDETWDVVFDLALKRPGREVERALTPKIGRHVVVGADGDRLLQSVLRAALRRPVRMFVAEARREDLETLAQMVVDGVLRPAIEDRVPLERAADAIRRVDEGTARGKVVVDIRPEHPISA